MYVSDFNKKNTRQKYTNMFFHAKLKLAKQSSEQYFTY